MLKINAPQRNRKVILVTFKLIKSGTKNKIIAEECDK
jgi:hypothetical protein